MNGLLTLHGIEKRFGPTVALAGVDLVVRPGSLHALLGENGAGKSTLMRIVAGLIRADAGRCEIDGAPYAARDPRDAQAHGIAMVHQHFTSVPALTVWENVALAARWPVRGARTRVQEQFEMRGVALDVDAPAGTLSVGLRQQLELQKALAVAPRFLLLDEPTGVLTPPEVAELFRGIREFTGTGGSVVLITHKLDEALEHADTITVLRRGVVTGEWRLGGTAPAPTKEALVAAMLGGTALAEPVEREAHRVGEVVHTFGGLALRAGEVVGVAGVEGNGQRELLRGFDAEALIPEDRTTEGTIGDFSLTENLALRPSVGGRSWSMDWGALRAQMSEMIERYRIVAASPDVPIGSLSGGNQQKVVVARALDGAPTLVVAENPARGLDVGAARETFERLREAATAGAAVLFYSTDLDEVLTWADRVVVMRGGELLTPPPEADRSVVGAMMVRREGAR